MRVIQDAEDSICPDVVPIDHSPSAPPPDFDLEDETVDHTPTAPPAQPWKSHQTAIADILPRDEVELVAA